MTIIYPNKPDNELLDLLKGLDIDQLILLMSWLKENHSRINSVSINNWKRLNNIS